MFFSSVGNPLTPPLLVDIPLKKKTFFTASLNGRIFQYTLKYPARNTGNLWNTGLNGIKFCYTVELFHENISFSFNRYSLKLFLCPYISARLCLCLCLYVCTESRLYDF